MTDAQTCQTGKLDPRVARSLKTFISDLQPPAATTSVEQIRDVKFKTPSFSKSDVQHIKISRDSIPIQVYNPAHGKGLGSISAAILFTSAIA